MDFENNTDGCQKNYTPDLGPVTPAASEPTPPKPPIHYIPTPPEKPKKSSGWRIFLNILLAFSLFGNVILFLVIMGIAAVVLVGSETQILEKSLVEGKGLDKIAVIDLSGTIEDSVSDDVRLQFEAASKDNAVKAVILRIDSPGGTVSASDRIHYYISKYRKETNKPVVAFMESMAASGGYYSAVACNTIVAEPTVITGSIGVIMNHIVIKDLLEQRLGIQPETLKSGERKDWPSMFSEMSDPQKQYIQDKLIGPAYERFVKLVCQGRANLTESQVRTLADGSIYPAEEALSKGLIDNIGYIDEAIKITEKMAGLQGANVVEYKRPLPWLSALGAQSKLPIIDTKAIEKIASPQLMYLWDGR